MNNATKKIMIQGKEAIIIYAFDILEEKVPSLKMNPKDYEISVWANKTKAYAEFKRRIRFVPMDETKYSYDIEVDLINKDVSPFEDWSYNENESLFFVPSQQEKEKIEFVKKHTSLPNNEFIYSISEEKNHYSISRDSKYSFSHYKIDKVTGEKSSYFEASYAVMEQPSLIDDDPIKEIYKATTKKEILKIISVEIATNPNLDEFIEITDILSITEFEKIKNFILKKGDRRFYRNYDGNNPHYHFDDFHAYLNSEIGQRNINNDPEISDFNEITVHDWNNDTQYYTIRIVRKGDIENELISVDVAIREDNSIYRMKESGVYLLNPYKKDTNLMLKNLKEHYLVEFRNQLSKLKK